jgi:hypothetical protein
MLATDLSFVGTRRLADQSIACRGGIAGMVRAVGEKSGASEPEFARTAQGIADRLRTKNG